MAKDLAQPWHVECVDGTWFLVEVNEHGGRHTWSFGKDGEAAARAELARWTAIGPCCECGGVINDNWIDSVKKRVLALKLCHSCLFWTDLLAAKETPGHFVAAGCHYAISPDQPAHYRGFVGHGGAEFTVRFKADGREVVTRNLWAQGAVPPNFRERLPDTAEFVHRGHRHIGSFAGYGGRGSADAEVAGD